MQFQIWGPQAHVGVWQHPASPSWMPVCPPLPDNHEGLWIVPGGGPEQYPHHWEPWLGQSGGAHSPLAPFTGMFRPSPEQPGRNSEAFPLFWHHFLKNCRYCEACLGQIPGTSRFLHPQRITVLCVEIMCIQNTLWPQTPTTKTHGPGLKALHEKVWGPLPFGSGDALWCQDGLFLFGQFTASGQSVPP